MIHEQNRLIILQLSPFFRIDVLVGSLGFEPSPQYRCHPQIPFFFK